MATTTKAKAKAQRTEPKRRSGMDLDKARAKKKEVDERSGGDYMELKEGWNTVFILPPWSDEGVVWKEVQRHGYHVCPAKTVGKRCIMCDELNRRKRKGDTEFVDEWRLKPTAYLNAILKTDVKAAEAGAVKVLRTSPSVFNEILDYIDDEDKDITDPTSAVPVMIKKTGTGMRTRYKTKFGDAIDISAFITPEFLKEALYDLDTIRAVMPASDKDLRKEIRGAADEDDDDDADTGADDDDDEVTDDSEEEEEELLEEPEDDEEEEKPARKATAAPAKAKAKKAAPPPDDDDDDDDFVSDEEEEQEDDEPPARKAKPAAKAKAVTERKAPPPEDDDDDDLEVEEDEDDDEEPPPRAAKKKATSSKRR